ncbi:MAG: hypothetical protein AB1586_10415 [Pseudomonadota bacterium]|jgi:hypothetical protein
MPRKVILFLLAAAMISGGVYLLAAELLTARILYSRLVVAGGFLIVLGGYLLWTDFIAPALRIKTWED